MRLAGIRFDVVSPAVSETRQGDPERAVIANAARKAEAGLGLAAPAAPVLGADTEVVVDGRALGKAGSRAEAEQRLRLLAGRSHEVLGGIVLITPDGQRRTALERTRVGFAALDEGLLAAYLDSGEWRDRAGAYAVQGLGAALVERIEGDLANVIGLPLRRLLTLVPELRRH